MSLYKIHNHLIAYGILQRIILLSAKFVFLLLIKRMTLIWLKKPVGQDGLHKRALFLFGLGIIHILSLLVFPLKKVS